MSTQMESRIYAASEGQFGAAGSDAGSALGSALRRLQPVVGLAVAASALIVFGRYGTTLGLSELETYKALRFIHIAIAIVALGSTFALPIIQPMAARSGTATLRFALKFSDRLENLIVTPGSILVIASGIGLILSAATGYSSDLPGWLIVGMGWVAVVVVVAVGVQGPARRKAIAVLESAPDSGPPPAALMPLGRRLEMVGRFLGASTIAVMFLMVWRPDF